MNRVRYILLVGIAAVLTFAAFIFMAILTQTPLMGNQSIPSDNLPDPPQELQDLKPAFSIERPKFKRVQPAPYRIDPHKWYPPKYDTLEPFEGSTPNKPQSSFPDPKFEVSMHDPYHGQLREHGRVVARMPENATRPGSCDVRMRVDSAGRVEKIIEVECTEKLFEKTTIMAVMKWFFHPLLDKGQPVPFETEVMKVGYRLFDESGNIIPEKPKD